MICTVCSENKTMRLSSFCENCFKKHNEYLKTRIRDVETCNESREGFLLRKSKELGLNYTAYQIKSMIRAGMTDALILKTEDRSPWTLGSEPSRAMSIDVIP